MGRTNARGRPVLDTIVNARSETLFAKSAFAGLRRCLLPVERLVRVDRRAAAQDALGGPGAVDADPRVAAVWDLWKGPGGAEVASLASVTCAPNAEVAAVHDRMPVILPPAAWPVWLGEAEGDRAADVGAAGGRLLLVERADGRGPPRKARRPRLPRVNPVSLI